MDRHKKMASQLKAVQDGSSKKDECINQLEAKLRHRDDKEITLSQSITRLVKAIFGRHLLVILNLFEKRSFLVCCANVFGCTLVRSR